MKRSIRKGFTLVELMVVIGILGLLVGILAVAVIPRMTQAKSKLELKQVGDIMSALQQVTIDNNNRQKLLKDKLKEAKGVKFYEQCIKQKLLDRDITNKLVSLKSNSDVKATGEWDELAPENCSYTSPKGGKFSEVMSFKGKQRTILLCFDSRNWDNYDDGVLVYWSDGEVATYMTPEEAAEHKLDATTFKDKSNASDIIGNKAPFNHTYEHKQ